MDRFLKRRYIISSITTRFLPDLIMSDTPTGCLMRTGIDTLRENLGSPPHPNTHTPLSYPQPVFFYNVFIYFQISLAFTKASKKY